MRLKCKLIDDHRESAEVQEHLIGVVLASGCVPRIVACFTEGARYDAVCLNEVGKCFALCDHKDVEHAGHVSRTSVLVLNKDQLTELHERGELRMGDPADLELIVKLLEIVSVRPVGAD